MKFEKVTFDYSTTKVMHNLFFSLIKIELRESTLLNKIEKAVQLR